MSSAVKSVLLTASFLVLAPAEGLTAPFDARQVPEGAKWLIHLDLEALRQTAAGQAVRDRWLAKDHVQSRLQKIQEEIGINPSEDILGATLYDTRFEKDHGVAMIHVRQIDARRLLDQLNEIEPDNKMVQFNSHKIYIWTHAHRKEGDRGTVCGTLYKNQLVVFSSDVLAVMSALEVLDGDKPALSAEKRMGEAPTTGTVFLLRGVELSSDHANVDCPLLKDSHWCEVQVGAHEKESFVRINVETTADDVAQNAKAVVDGFRALMELRQDNGPLEKLLDRVEVTTSGADFSVRWSMDEGEAMEAVKGLRMRGKKHVDELRKHWKLRMKTK